MSFKEITAVNRLIIELKFKQHNFYVLFYSRFYMILYQHLFGTSSQDLSASQWQLQRYSLPLSRPTAL